MLTAVTSAPGRIEIANVDSEPVAGPGEVTIAVESVGICGSDLHVWTGENPYFRYPGVQGHEFGGRVLSIGAGSSAPPFGIGERVAVEPFRSCGSCLPCRRGRANCCVRLEVMGAHIPGAFAERLVVPAASCYPVGDLDRTLTALVEPIAIGCQAVHRAGIGRDDSVAILGAGPIGLAALIASVDRGARVLAADRLPARLDHATAAGAQAVVDVGAEDLTERVSSWTGGDGPSVVIEATGVPAVVRQAVEIVAASGTVVILGLSRADVTLSLLDFTRKELTVMGSRNNARQFEAAIDLIARQPTVVAGLVTNRFPLARISEAMQIAHDHPAEVMKVMIDVEPS